MAAPFLAGPAIVGYLKANGLRASLLDANCLFWNHFKSPQEAVEIWNKCFLEKDSAELRIEEGIVATWAANSTKDEFVEWLTSSRVDSPTYELLVRCFGGFKKRTHWSDDDSLRYHDKYFADISQSYASLNSAFLFDVTFKDSNNPWRSFAREHVLPAIEERGPDVLGISIVAPNQVVPGFAIAAEARRAWPRIHIIFGGAWVTHLREQIPKIHWFQEQRFHFVPFQGESVLEQIMKIHKSDEDIRQICRNALDSKTPRYRLPLDSLPTPDFSDLELDAYAEPHHLPLMASRGCYWSRCKFCSYPLLEPKYEIRSTERLRGDLVHYVKRYNASHIPFADPSMSVPVAKRVAKNVKTENLNLTWGAFARLESQFTRKIFEDLARHGCVVIHWGLETGSDRIQRELGKGIELDTVRNVLSDAAEAGIHNRVLMMYGFPQETEEDLYASIDLIETLLPSVGSVCWSRCTIEIDTALSEIVSQNRCTNGVDLALGTIPVTLYSQEFLRDREMQMQTISARLAMRNSGRTSIER
jgi:hypothetical protein